MALTPEVQAYVDTLKFKSEDTKAAYVKLLEDPETAEQAFMFQSDYTKKTQQTAEEKRRFEAEKQQWEEGRNYYDEQINTYKTDVESRLNKALQAAADSSTRGAALEAKLRKLAAEYGADPDELLADVTTRRDEPEKKHEFSFDDIKDKVVGRDEYNAAANSFFSFTPQIRDFEREYQREFGKEYEGSITDLVAEASNAVQERRKRNPKDQTNLFSYMREKLDFAGQKTRNAETAKITAQKEREDWEKSKTEEIERNLRSKIVAENPRAFDQPANTEEWRQTIAKSRKPTQDMPVRPAQSRDQRRTEIAKIFEETTAAKQPQAA
jgi:hypothetical protein